MAADQQRLTKADTVALWHAVEWMALCLKQSADLMPSDTMATERQRLAAARRALRKVNAIRRHTPAGVKVVPESEQVRRLREALEHCEQWLPKDCAAAIEARDVLATYGVDLPDGGRDGK